MNETDKSHQGRLTQSDIQYLQNIKSWVQSSLRFTLLGIKPCEDDVVYMEKDLPCFFRRTKQCLKGQFVSLNELVQLCEEAAINKMIYESFLHSALENIYHAKSVLNHDDGERLLKFFKQSYDIEYVDEAIIHAEAIDSINEAKQLLYGGAF